MRIRGIPTYPEWKKENLKSIESDFRNYLKDMAEDEGCVVSEIENWETWVIHEYDVEFFHRCDSCGSLNTHDGKCADCKGMTKAGRILESRNLGRQVKTMIYEYDKAKDIIQKWLDTASVEVMNDFIRDQELE